MPDSILDLFRTAATGQPDPYTQLAQGLQGQPGSPSAASGAAGPAPAPPTAAGPQGPQAGQPGQPGQAPSPAEAQSYQSPPDMVQLYMKFAQQERADDMFNRGIANIAAGFSPVSQRAAIAQSGVGTTQDPGALFNNIMQLQQYRQQQLGALDAAKTLGITPNEAMAMPQDSIRTAMAIGIQPDDLRKYNAFANQYAQQHQYDKDPTTGQPIGLDGARKQFELQAPMTSAAAAATGGAAVDPQRQQMQLDAADLQRNGQPVPFTDVNSWQNWKLRTQQEQNDRGKALAAHGELNANTGELVDRLGAVSANPDLPALVGSSFHQGLPFPTTLGPGAFTLHTTLQDMQNKAAELAAKAGPGTQSSLQGLNSTGFNLTRYSIPADQYRTTVIQPMIKQGLSAQAGSFGASGQTDLAPGYLKKYIPQVYQPGGELYVKSAGAAPAANPSLKQMSQADMDNAQKQIELYGPKIVADHFKAKGYDTLPFFGQ